jgi:hypothetical protein
MLLRVSASDLIAVIEVFVILLSYYTKSGEFPATYGYTDSKSDFISLFIFFLNKKSRLKIIYIYIYIYIYEGNL